MAEEIELGLEVRDAVTGFTGTSTARCTHLGGSTQIEITPKAGEDGSYRKPQWFEEARIQRLS